MSKEEEQSQRIRQLSQIASQNLDFDRETPDTLTKRYEVLKEILVYLKGWKESGKTPPESVYLEIMTVCECFTVRPEPKPDSSYLSEAEWRVVSIAYVLLQILISFEDSQIFLRNFLSESYLSALVQGFSQPDQRERDKIKVVIHRLYCRLYTRRAILRKNISDLLLRHVYQETVLGVKETLELYGCIANGFAVPILKEHRIFLEKVLLPLHKPEDLPNYHRFLVFCLVCFLYKEPSLGRLIFAGILKYWPRLNPDKEVVFLQEVDDLLQVIDPYEFKTIHEKLLKQISMCILSPCYQVSERALTIFDSQKVLFLCLSNTQTVYPALLPGLLSAPKSTPPGKILRLLSRLEAGDPDLFKILTTPSQAEAKSWNETISGED